MDVWNDEGLAHVSIAITPTSRYCYKSWACDSDVVIDVTHHEDYAAKPTSEPVVSRERCFRELGGHSWGLYGDNCEKRTGDPQQPPAHYVPDTLHGSLCYVINETTLMFLTDA